jgi:hypothetical protein
MLFPVHSKSIAKTIFLIIKKKLDIKKDKTMVASSTAKVNETLRNANSSSELSTQIKNNNVPSSSLPGDRPIGHSTFEIRDTVNLLGMRPIVSSDLQISDTINLAGVRPIVSSDLQVSDTIDLAGVRPIGSSNLQVSNTIDLLGIRPIASSDIKVSKTIATSGIRPIAANILEKYDDLMGYID